MKLSLPTTTLFLADCVSQKSLNISIKVLERCKHLCDFAEVKLLTSLETDYQHKVEIKPLNTLVEYSIFMLKKAHEYINTKHVLIVQGDGWILNPDKWEDEWLSLDYIGALFNQDYHGPAMGVGGFNFRSKAIMEAMSKLLPIWYETPESTQAIQNKVGYYEDGVFALGYRKHLESRGFKFASLTQGSRFSAGGNPDERYYVERPFGFHGSWKAFDQHTGIVSKELKHDGHMPEPI